MISKAPSKSTSASTGVDRAAFVSPRSTCQAKSASSPENRDNFVADVDVLSWRTTANRHRSQCVYDLLMAEAERAEVMLSKRRDAKQKKTTTKKTRKTSGEDHSDTANMQDVNPEYHGRMGTRPRSPGNTPSRRTRQRIDMDTDLPSPRTFEVANILADNQDPI